MRQYNPKVDGLFFKFDAYLAPYDINNPTPLSERAPLFLREAKEALKPGTPPEIIEMFEKWKPLAKKQDEEDAKFNYIFA